MAAGLPRPYEPLAETVTERRMRRLNSFPQPYRKYIAGLTSCAPAVEDLADSFPGLLFALATGYGSVRRRQAAFEAVVAGHSLKLAAGFLELPLWLRRLPPQAFMQPLPLLPSDEEFTAVAVNRVPDQPRDAALWFERMVVSHRLAGREFALWAMREPRMLPPHTTDEDMQWLLAWAWASLNPDFEGHGLLRGAWSPAIGWKRARDEVAIWRKRIDLVGALAGGPRDPWFRNASVSGFDIVALSSVEDFINESIAMENCLDQYAAHLAYGRVRIFSIRRDGRSIADVEVTLKPDDAATPCISQVRGPRNRRAPPAIWQAVHAWLAAQSGRPIDLTSTSAQATREAFRKFWQPYVVAAESAGLPPHVLARVLGRDARRAKPNTLATPLAGRAIDHEPPPTARGIGRGTEPANDRPVFRLAAPGRRLRANG
ncbi:MAG: PcfJ domain-containing protein [Hyphomicrobiaceae bacterium]